jgi:hypothetical protein
VDHFLNLVFSALDVRKFLHRLQLWAWSLSGSMWVDFAIYGFKLGFHFWSSITVSHAHAYKLMYL